MRFLQVVAAMVVSFSLLGLSQDISQNTPIPQSAIDALNSGQYTDAQIAEAAQQYQQNGEVTISEENQSDTDNDHTERSSEESEEETDDQAGGKGGRIYRPRFSIENYLDRSKTLPFDHTYGRSVFKEFSRPGVAFETPDNYILIPGDEVILRFWGSYTLDKRTTVSPDGYIYFDPIRKQQHVTGMTYGALKAIVGDIVESKIGVDGEVRVISNRKIKINVAGEAKNPGSISVPPFYNFWQTLMVSGGPSSMGSIRNIALVRQGEVVNKIDIYAFLQSGEWPDVGMRENDLLFFSRRGAVAGVGDFVNRPGVYELTAEETLKELVSHAGGLSTSELSSVIHVDRLIPLQQIRQDGPTRTTLDISLVGENWETVSINNLDLLYSKPKSARYENDVTITGNGVFVPGRYAIGAEIRTLKDLVDKAGGLTPGHYTRAEIVRPTTTGTRSVAMDLSSTAELAQFQLIAGDVVKTYHETQFISLTNVRSTGFFRETIQVPFSETISLLSLIQRSKGIREGALDYVLVIKTDLYGNVSYNKYDISDSVMLQSVLLDPRDQVMAFDYRDFNHVPPVTVLALGREPLKINYSDQLTMDIIIHKLKGLDYFLDKDRVEILTPLLSDFNKISAAKTVELSAQNLEDVSLISAGAIVSFRGDPRKSPPKIVTLSGAFQSPGSYGLTRRDETLSSIIKRSGGLHPGANPHSIKVIRRGGQDTVGISPRRVNPLRLRNDWIVADGDRIHVQQDMSYVRVQGAVFDPSLVPYDQSFSWRDYINRGAGGALDTADMRKTFIRYPNGTTVRARRNWISNADVVSGSTIIVPIKPYIEPKEEKSKIDSEDILRFLTVISTAASTLLTLIIVADRI